MQEQFDNKLLSSFLLYLDNKILTDGLAYTNTSGNLYSINHKMYGKYAYATPYRQLVDDVSITGANILSGVTINGSFLTVGVSGLHSIDQKEGIVYFDSPQSNTISATYAVKDFSIYPTSKPEETLIFETKYFLRNEIPQTISGLKLASQTIPIIFSKIFSSENEPLCFGHDNNNVKIKSVILSHNSFLLDAASNIAKNMAKMELPLISSSDLPFNQFGHYTGLAYNYNNLSSNAQKCLIWKVRLNDLSTTNSFNTLNPSIFAATADCEIWGNVS